MTWHGRGWWRRGWDPLTRLRLHRRQLRAMPKWHGGEVCIGGEAHGLTQPAAGCWEWLLPWQIAKICQGFLCFPLIVDLIRQMPSWEAYFGRIPDTTRVFREPAAGLGFFLDNCRECLLTPFLTRRVSRSSVGFASPAVAWRWVVRSGGWSAKRVTFLPGPLLYPIF